MQKLIIYGIIVWFLGSCHSQSKKSAMKETKNIPDSANHLINSTSPYLLQHAYNPVEWYPWGEEALKRARKEDKPILVSIGYSSCHWCHVMERESFENDSIAEIMNENFICIKVDREERPDVDQIYMDAVQAMGQNGGWPLNVFLTSDQKPFYGGTYFPPEGWSQLLRQIAKVYENKREEIENSAQQLTEAIATSETVKYKLKGNAADFQAEALDNMYANLSAKFDKQHGGFDRAPKFPMPGNWLFLLRYYHNSQNQEALNQTKLTLDEIANGGIYDQVGGGFARYSTDAKWLVPHFEKMLYDNGQLVSLYSEAYSITQKTLYKEVVYQTINWLEREMMDKQGGFYSALDADSEGEEGRFYVWTEKEIEEVLTDQAPLFIDYYNVTEEGNWENGKNILHTTVSDSDFAKRHNIAVDELDKQIKAADRLLLKRRSTRIRPGLDDKVLSGWNGLMLKGVVDAYNAFSEDKFLNLALKNAEFIQSKMISDGKLYRSYKEGKVSIDAYLEDYAFVIDAFTALYQATFDERWLHAADDLAQYTLKHFYDPEENLFHFTDNSSERLIARKKEVFDNVIPASNSQMAIDLHFLGIIMDNENYKTISRKMVSKMTDLLATETTYLSNWAILYTYFTYPTAEVAIIGPGVKKMRQQFATAYNPNKVLMGSSTNSDLPLLEGKTSTNGKTTIYVCYNKTCKLPVQDVEKAFAQLR